VGAGAIPLEEGVVSDLTEVVIAPKTEGKGRAFRAMKVSAVMADGLWPQSGNKDGKYDRPVCATFVSSEGEIRPFVANLLSGRPAIPLGNSNYHRRHGTDSGYEFMKSVGYKAFFFRVEEGTAATVYLPDLFAVDPGMVDPSGARFVILESKDKLAKEAEKMEVEDTVDYVRALPMVKEVNEAEKDWRGTVREGWKEPLSKEVLADMVPMAYLFTLYLSNRSRAPIPPDGRFYVQFLVACLKHGLASWPGDSSYYRNDYYRNDREFGKHGSFGFSEENADAARLVQPIAFKATHEEIEALLSEQCAEYFRLMK